MSHGKLLGYCIIPLTQRSDFRVTHIKISVIGKNVANISLKFFSCLVSKYLFKEPQSVVFNIGFFFPFGILVILN